VLTQISAVRAALYQVALELLSEHAAACVIGAPEGWQQERTDELMGAVTRLIGRR
jgi:DNA-binding FrmR family transcriptional regulator